MAADWEDITDAVVALSPPLRGVVYESPVPESGRVPADCLRRADVLGDEARMPGQPIADDPDAPEAEPYPPEEQGEEGP